MNFRIGELQSSHPLSSHRMKLEILPSNSNPPKQGANQNIVLDFCCWYSTISRQQGLLETGVWFMYVFRSKLVAELSCIEVWGIQDIFDVNENSHSNYASNSNGKILLLSLGPKDHDEGVSSFWLAAHVALVIPGIGSCTTMSPSLFFYFIAIILLFTVSLLHCCFQL